MFYLAIFLGMREGRKRENERCRGIIMRALQVRMSPTAREALVCIAGNQTRQKMVRALEKLDEDKKDLGEWIQGGGDVKM